MTKVLRSLLVVVFVALVGRPIAAQQPRREPLKIEDAITALSFALYQQVSLSPDGQWVAYCLTDVRRREPGPLKPYAGGDVWITNTTTGESKNLTGEKGNNWGHVWSPDGRYLAYYSEAGPVTGLWVWERATGKSRLVLANIKHGFTDTSVWTPDSKTLITTMAIEGAAGGESRRSAGAQASTAAAGDAGTAAKGSKSTVIVLSSPAAAPDDKGGLRDGSKGLSLGEDPVDLVAVDVATGKTEKIAHKVNPSQMRFSADGQTLAFLNRKGLDTATGFFQLFDLTVLSLRDKRGPLILVPGIRQGSISWAPDGKLLAYTAAEGECFVISPEQGAQPRKLAATAHPPFASQFRSPLWDPSGKSLYFLTPDALWRISLEDGKTVEVGRVPGRKLLEIVAPGAGGRFWSPDQGQSAIVVTRDDETKRVGYYKLDLASGKSSKLLEEDKRYGPIEIFNTDVSSDGQRVVYVAQDSTHGSDVWIADAQFSTPKRLTRVNPKLDGYEYGQSRLIDYRSIDGELLHGALLLPVGYETGKRYPLVVWIYGGARLSNSVNEFGLAGDGPLNMQIYATRGYAVLLPDTPVHPGTPMQDLVKTVLPAVDKVVEMGIADTNKVGVMGHSYGGYSTLALIVQTTRFKAAISSAGPANLINSYGHLDKEGFAIDIGWAETKGGQGGMEGSPWQFRDRYIENSPIFYLDRVQTPLLIMHGEADSRVPVHLADEVFVGMRRLGKEVVYARYAGEDHSPIYWGYANMVDYCQRIVDWYDSHLQLKAAAAVKGTN
jgi:dipeptidyl aminopeptidase/acylaminoacyl peptidase